MTRLRYQLQLGTLSTTRFMRLLETFTIMFDELTATRFLSSDFLQFQKVSDQLLPIWLTLIMLISSGSGIPRRCKVSQISPTTIPFISCRNLAAYQSRDDHTTGYNVSRWTLSTGNIRARSLHSRLSRAGDSFVYCPTLVPSVRKIIYVP